ncbi:MAG: hypothetical protein LUF28_10400, partial [Clostridiales bacterium]|nr:hypothetical protein [Clostridiales bacterium]
MPEKKGIPLLKLFPRLSVRGRLLTAARECTILSATIHQARRSVELAVAFRSPQTTDVQRALERAILSAYDLSDVLLQPAPQEEVLPEPAGDDDIPLPEAPPEEDAPPPPEDSFAPVELPEGDVFPETENMESNTALQQNKAPERPAAPTREEKLRKALAAHPAVTRAGKKARRADSAAPSGNLLYGKGIRGNVIPMSDLSLDLGTVCVSGRIFQDNSRQLKNRNAWIVSFDMTDETNSVTVSKFLEQKQAEPLMEALKKTPWVTVEGKLSLSHYSGDMELTPYAIAPAKAPKGRMDNA